MPDHENPDPSSAAEAESEQEKAKEDMQQEMLDKMPEKIEPAQEWGGRYDTGKTIATGGQPGDLKSKEDDDDDTDQSCEKKKT